MRDRVALLARNRTVQAGAAHDDDIIDPQGKGDDAYRLMARQEVPSLAALAGAFLGMPDAEVAAYRAAGEAAEFPLDTKSRDSAASSDRSPGRHEA
jgi:protein-tyrosine phosphatase